MDSSIHLKHKYDLSMIDEEWQRDYISDDEIEHPNLAEGTTLPPPGNQIASKKDDIEWGDLNLEAFN